jgi:hypothetical protein
MSRYKYNRQVSPPAPFVYVSVCAAVGGTMSSESPAQRDTNPQEPYVLLGRDVLNHFRITLGGPNLALTID